MMTRTMELRLSPIWIVERGTERGGKQHWFVCELVWDATSGQRVTRAYHGPFQKGQAQTLAALLNNTYARGRLAGREDS